MNALIQQRQLLANQPVQSLCIRSVQNTFFFLNREAKAFPTLFTFGLVCFCFFINSTFDLGPGVIACITGVSFSLFSRLQNSLYFSVNSSMRGSQTTSLERGWKQRARLGRDVFFSLASHGRLRLARKTLTARALPISLLILRKKTDCLAVYFFQANEGIPSGKRARSAFLWRLCSALLTGSFSIDNGDSSENATWIRVFSNSVEFTAVCWKC